MGKTLGIDRETARRIKRMSRQELDGYLSRVTDRSYDNGYEEGLVNGIALAGQALDTVLKKYEADGALTALAVEEITKAVGQYIAETPEKAKQQLKAETAAAGEDQGKKHASGVTYRRYGVAGGMLRVCRDICIVNHVGGA